MLIRCVAGSVALAMSCVTALGQPAPSATQSASRRDLSSLPQTLSALQQATRYLDWEPVRAYSRSLKHYRQLRIDKASNVLISETGAKPGRVDVVEVILMPRMPESEAEFALYDPQSDKRVVHYPEHIKFDVEGIAGGSRNAAPGLCVACHQERMPLNALVPWSQALEDGLKKARATGQGIRQDLLAPVPDDEATRDRIIALNKLLQDQFGDRLNDFRTWMAR
jgi:hypothetical protein